MKLSVVGAWAASGSGRARSVASRIDLMAFIGYSLGAPHPDIRLRSILADATAVCQSAAFALSVLARGVPLRHHRRVIDQDRLQRVAAFVAQLHRLSIRNPYSWRRAEGVGRAVGLEGAHLEEAIRDAERAGLIERRADDEGLIILTAAGRAAASQ